MEQPKSEEQVAFEARLERQMREDHARALLAHLLPAKRLNIGLKGRALLFSSPRAIVAGNVRWS